MAYFISVNIFKTKQKKKQERDGTVCEKFHRVKLFSDADKVWKANRRNYLTHTLTQSNKRKININSEAHFVPFFVC